MLTQIFLICQYQFLVISHVKHHIFIITGATASGKSNVALYIAQHIKNTEIISADSMQVYRKMDIGTAKVPISVRKNIHHYLIDVVDPWESYNLGKYVRDAQEIVFKNKNSEKHLKLIVGGTGLYIKGIVHGVFSGPEADWDFRNQLKLIVQKNGDNHLHYLLNQIDPVSAARLHPKDQNRIIRALEVYEKTGIAISKLQSQCLNQKPGFDYTIFVINRSKEDLHNRIEDRVEKMFELGLVDEVNSLWKASHGLSKQACQALGYKETIQYLNNEIDLCNAKILIKQNTKKFAKRQLTWFKSFSNTHWIKADTGDNCEIPGNIVLCEIEKHLNKRQ